MSVRMKYVRRNQQSVYLLQISGCNRDAMLKQARTDAISDPNPVKQNKPEKLEQMKVQ